MSLPITRVLSRNGSSNGNETVTTGLFSAIRSSFHGSFRRMRSLNNESNGFSRYENKGRITPLSPSRLGLSAVPFGDEIRSHTTQP